MPRETIIGTASPWPEAFSTAATRERAVGREVADLLKPSCKNRTVLGSIREGG